VRVLDPIRKPQIVVNCGADGVEQTQKSRKIYFNEELKSDPKRARNKAGTKFCPAFVISPPANSVHCVHFLDEEM